MDRTLTSYGYKLLVFVCLILLHSSSVIASGPIKLQDDYYRYSCPRAEAVIAEKVVEEFEKEPGGLQFASGILRLAFHDCFVDGCDASVLLDGPHSEKTATINKFLKGFEILDVAKAAVEEICPGVVSCADLLAYAARDSTAALGALTNATVTWKVQGGRKDGFVSSAEAAEAELPGADLDVAGLVASFASKGLSQDEMVILSGSHTTAIGHCDALKKRLYNFNETNKIDPSIPADFAAELKATCPQFIVNDTVQFFMDGTPAAFDSNYYETLKEHRGVFTSDQVLYDDTRTRPLVKFLSTHEHIFQKKFGKAMRAMSAIGIKYHGEIRKNCRKPNFDNYPARP